ncbi:hypothetical protein Tco_1547935 [Tanacetum coccineum]
MQRIADEEDVDFNEEYLDENDSRHETTAEVLAWIFYLLSKNISMELEWQMVNSVLSMWNIYYVQLTHVWSGSLKCYSASWADMHGAIMVVGASKPTVVAYKDGYFNVICQMTQEDKLEEDDEAPIKSISRCGDLKWHVFGLADRVSFSAFGMFKSIVFDVVALGILCTTHDKAFAKWVADDAVLDVICFAMIWFLVVLEV